jgi:hypothetical protein
MDEYEIQGSHPLLCFEYATEIFSYLWKRERVLAPSDHYMDHQPELSWSMRSILIQWMVQVHDAFSLSPEVLHLSIGCMDRFLSLKAVSVQKFQLVGLVALVIAGKVEEIYPPRLVDWIACADSAFSRSELLAAESFFLKYLGFQVSAPSPYHFLRRLSAVDGYALAPRTLAKYLMELSLLDERFLSFPTSATVAACMLLSRQLLKMNSPWSSGHVWASGYSLSELSAPRDTLLDLLRRQGLHNSFIVHKYAGPAFGGVSQWLSALLDRS